MIPFPMRTFLTCLCLLCGILNADTWQLFEERIELEGVLEGDTFLLANELSLNATFTEDVWTAGRKIEFTGETRDDLRVAALEVVSIDGTVDGSATLISSVGNVVLSTNAVIGADAVLQAGKRITLNGEIKGDAWVEAPRIVMSGRVDGDLIVKSRDLQLLPGTTIGGDLVNRGTQPLPVPDGVTVLGERRQIQETPSEFAGSLQQIQWMIRGIQFITSLAIGLAMLRLFPRFTGQNVDLLLNRQGPLVSIGVLAFLALTLVGYFLLFSVVGTGIGLFLLLITGLLFYTGKIFVAFLIGMLVLRQKTDLAFRKLSLAYLIGLTVLYTVSMIPYIGGTIYILTSCWGMGAMLVSLRLSQQGIHLHVPSSTTHETP